MWEKIALGAVLGALGALTADTDSARKSFYEWDWQVAMKRAVAGAIVGAAGAAGLGSVVAL
jgi:hypothetical protein